MKILLISLFVATLAPQGFAYLQCPTNCNLIICFPSLMKNCNGYVLQPGEDCNCCQRCVEFVGLGKKCVSKYGNQLKCAANLTCSPVTKTCVRECDENSCNSIDCPQVDDCPLGSFKRPSGFCNCCSECAPCSENSTNPECRQL